MSATVRWLLRVPGTGSPAYMSGDEIETGTKDDGTFNPKVLGSIPNGVT